LRGSREGESRGHDQCGEKRSHLALHFVIFSTNAR